MEEQEEFCALCESRRPLTKLYPLVSHHEETRQYTCRRELPCYIRTIWKTRGFSRLFGDDD